MLFNLSKPFLFGIILILQLFQVANSQEAASGSAPTQAGISQRPGTESSWSMPLVATGQAAVIQASGDPSPATEFLVDPFSALVAPADGVLVYKGSCESYAACMVISHGAGTYSLLLSSLDWDVSLYGAKVGGVVRRGEFLANAGGGANLQVPVLWQVKTGVPEGLQQIPDLLLPFHTH